MPALGQSGWASLVAQQWRIHLPVQETRIWSLGGEDPLEKEMATHSNIAAWKIPWTEEPGRLQSMGSKGVGHNWVTSLHFKPCQSPCDFLDCSMPVSSVFHYLLEFAHIHVHWVSDAIHQSHPLFLPSVFPILGSFPHQVAKVLELRL